MKVADLLLRLQQLPSSAEVLAFEPTTRQFQPVTSYTVDSDARIQLQTFGSDLTNFLGRQGETSRRCVLQEWVQFIPMMQQSVLISAVRGPDGLPKYGGGAKMLLRWLRRCVLLSAIDKRVLADPIEPNGGSFTGPSLEGTSEDHWSDRMQVHVNDYLRQLDALPHHFQMHFMHAVEILGYHHPDHEIRFFWYQLYLRLVHDMHVWPETKEQLDDRLGDSRSGWLNRADPATSA